jgi:hypothetical protein
MVRRATGRIHVLRAWRIFTLTVYGAHQAKPVKQHIVILPKDPREVTPGVRTNSEPKSAGGRFRAGFRRRKKLLSRSAEPNDRCSRTPQPCLALELTHPSRCLRCGIEAPTYDQRSPVIIQTAVIRTWSQRGVWKGTRDTVRAIGGNLRRHENRCRGV